MRARVIRGLASLTLSFAGVCFLAAAACAGDIFYAQGPSGSSKMALTYDDGPGPVTKDLLALLAAKNVKAAFFMTGENVNKKPDIAAEVCKAGHLPANHTYSHKNYYKLDKDPARENILTKELDLFEAAIMKSCGKRTRFLRMPNGFIKDWVKKIAATKGFIVVNWTYGSDWTSVPEEKMTAEYVKNIRPGAIFLLHDGGSRRSREKTLRITEKIIAAAEEKKISIVRLDELLGEKDLK